MDFCIGDRVILIKTSPAFNRAGHRYDDYGAHENDFGHVVQVDNEDGTIGVEFDKRLSDGHSCGGRGEYGYCLWIFPECLTLERTCDTINDDDLAFILNI